MKNIILLFFISFFVLGCSSDDNDPFYGFKVENITGIDIKSITRIQVIDRYSEHQTSTKTALYGIKNEKIWISIFDNSTKKEIYEYTYKEKIPTTIDRPYGEVFNVASFRVNVNEFGELITITGEYLNYVPQDGFLYPNTGDSKLDFDGILISKNGNTRITSLHYYSWYENSIICYTDNAYTVFKQNGEQINIKTPPAQDFLPLSFTHGISIGNYCYYYNFENYNTGVKKSGGIQEVVALVQEGKTDYNHISYEIKESDSSFANIIYHITFITGEVADYLLKIDLLNGNYQWMKVSK